MLLSGCNTESPRIPLKKLVGSKLSFNLCGVPVSVPRAGLTFLQVDGQTGYAPDARGVDLTYEMSTARPPADSSLLADGFNLIIYCNIGDDKNSELASHEKSRLDAHLPSQGLDRYVESRVADGWGTMIYRPIDLKSGEVRGEQISIKCSIKVAEQRRLLNKCSIQRQLSRHIRAIAMFWLDERQPTWRRITDFMNNKIAIGERR